MEMDESWREKMNKGRIEGKFCDFKVIIGRETFPVHRIILDTFSNYFRGMFANKMEESEQGFCEIPGFTAETGKICIDYLYTGKVDLSSKVVAIETLKLFHLWEVDSAVRICERFLVEHLDLQTFVQSRKVAALYVLKDLDNSCNAFAYHHVDELKEEHGIADLTLVDIKGILVYSSSRSPDAAKLWNFVVLWRGCQRHEVFFCALFETIPFRCFSVSNFLSLVWDDEHVKSCRNCQRHSARHVLDRHHLRDIEVKNCLSLKRIARNFQLAQFENDLDEFIVRNHEKVFEHPDFLAVEEDDMLKYIRGIRNECSLTDFDNVMTWIQCKTERFESFSTIYQDEKSGGNQFQEDLRKIWKRADRESGFSLFVFKFFGGGRLKFRLKWCILTKTLSRRYNCVNLEKDVDQFIVKNMSRIDEMDDIFLLTASDMREYSSHLLTSGKGHQQFWKGLVKWLKHDVDIRRQDFIEIFHILPLEQFPTDFLQKEICNFELVRESLLCMNRLINVVFERLENVEKRFEKRFESIEKKLDKLEGKKQ